MTHKKQSAEEPEEYEDAPEFLPAPMPEVSQRRAPDRTPAFLRFVPPADSEGEGRAYTMPYTADRERWRRFIRGATDTTGIFPVEIRNRNQAIIGRDSIAVEPEQYAPRIPQQNASPTPAQYHTPQVPGGTTEAVTTARELVGLAKDLSPPQPSAPSVTREDVQSIVRDSLAEVLREVKPSPAPPMPDIFETVDKVLTMQERVRKSVEPTQSTAPPKPDDPIENFLGMYERMQELSERVTPNPAGKSWLDKLGSGVESLSRAAERSAPFIIRLLASRQGMQGTQMSPPVPPGTQPQPDTATQPQGQQTQQQQFPAGLVSAARALAKEVTRDDIRKGADIVQSLLKSEPMLAFELQELFSAPSMALVEWLANVAGAPWLIDLPHGIAYFDVLKEELSERSQGEQNEEGEGVEQAQASANGNGAPGASVNV